MLGRRNKVATKKLPVGVVELDISKRKIDPGFLMLFKIGSDNCPITFEHLEQVAAWVKDSLENKTPLVMHHSVTVEMIPISTAGHTLRLVRVGTDHYPAALKDIRYASESLDAALNTSRVLVWPHTNSLEVISTIG